MVDWVPAGKEQSTELVVRPVLLATSPSDLATPQRGSAPGPRVLVAGSGKRLPELSLEGIMEPTPHWARALRSAPAAMGKGVQALERGGCSAPRGNLELLLSVEVR